MTPDAERLITFAQKKLRDAERILAIEVHETAGREAYHAALAAARALIVNSGRKAPKTHNGTCTVFADVLRSGVVFDHKLAQFLADGFEIKSAADYADGAPVEREDAEDAILRARSFIEAAQALLA
jgi:uncharacterized protein (UPF0332 family)